MKVLTAFAAVLIAGALSAEPDADASQGPSTPDEGLWTWPLDPDGGLDEDDAGEDLKRAVDHLVECLDDEGCGPVEPD